MSPARRRSSTSRSTPSSGEPSPTSRRCAPGVLDPRTLRAEERVEAGDPVVAEALTEIRRICLAVYRQLELHLWVAPRLATDAAVLTNSLRAFDTVGRALRTLDLTDGEQFHAVLALLKHDGRRGRHVGAPPIRRGRTATGAADRGTARHMACERTGRATIRRGNARPVPRAQPLRRVHRRTRSDPRRAPRPRRRGREENGRPNRPVCKSSYGRRVDRPGSTRGRRAALARLGGPG